MSVLSCDRRGCVNIMCDRLSHEYGYICDDCFDELVSLGLGADISEFMQSDKTDVQKYFDAEDYFHSIFPYPDSW